MSKKTAEMGHSAAREDYQNSIDLEVAEAIGSFNSDPADDDFQRGYLAELKLIFVEMQKGQD